MRVAVFGGAFDPPHMGHAMVAGWLRWADRADEVWLVPSSAHPFGKESRPHAERVGWCEALAAEVGPWVRVCGIESELGTPSYTLHTLRELARRHPTHRFQLVIGADNLAVRDKWMGWAAIASEFAPIVVGRAGYPEPPDAPVFPGVSSTEIRARLAAGEPVDHLVPAAVLARMGGAYREIAGPRPTTP